MSEPCEVGPTPIWTRELERRLPLIARLLSEGSPRARPRPERVPVQRGRYRRRLQGSRGSQPANAGEAHYSAKRLGKNRVEVYR